MKEFYHKWYTPYLNRDFEMLVFGGSGYPIILFPTSEGRYYECKDHGLVSSADQLLDEGKIKIYCPDGIDFLSWDNYDIHPADRVKTHNAYEKVIINDVIKFAVHETGYKRVGVAGCSFGGYHSFNLAMRSPDLIDSIISMCSTFDIKPYIFGHYDENCYLNNPPDYLPHLEDEWYLDRIRKMNIILGTGNWDICLEENKSMSNILALKEIKHSLDIRTNTGHDWNWWREMFPEYISQIIFNKIDKQIVQ
jgi:esterase/lipase superfamily enzyme